MVWPSLNPDGMDMIVVLVPQVREDAVRGPDAVPLSGVRRPRQQPRRIHAKHDRVAELSTRRRRNTVPSSGTRITRAHRCRRLSALRRSRIRCRRTSVRICVSWTTVDRREHDGGVRGTADARRYRSRRASTSGIRVSSTTRTCFATRSRTSPRCAPFGQRRRTMTPTGFPRRLCATRKSKLAFSPSPRKGVMRHLADTPALRHRGVDFHARYGGSLAGAVAGQPLSGGRDTIKRVRIRKPVRVCHSGQSGGRAAGRVALAQKLIDQGLTSQRKRSRRSRSVVRAIPWARGSFPRTQPVRRARERAL